LAGDRGARNGNVSFVGRIRHRRLGSAEVELLVFDSRRAVDGDDLIRDQSCRGRAEERHGRSDVSAVALEDLGAIAVIAIFYGKSMSFVGLAGVVIVLLIVFLLRRLQIWYLPIYVVFTLIAGDFMLRSGVHATVAGVALANCRISFK